MKIFKLIYQGWKNWIIDLISDLKYKKQFDERLSICKVCEKNTMGICRQCGCVIKAKTKSEDSSCPMGKWKTIKETLKENYEQFYSI